MVVDHRADQVGTEVPARPGPCPTEADRASRPLRSDRFRGETGGNPSAALEPREPSSRPAPHGGRSMSAEPPPRPARPSWRRLAAPLLAVVTVLAATAGAAAALTSSST